MRIYRSSPFSPSSLLSLSSSVAAFAVVGGVVLAQAQKEEGEKEADAPQF